jgi:hypothetical protein
VICRLFFLSLLVACAAESKPPPKVEMIHLEPITEPTSANGTSSDDAGRDPHSVELLVGAIATLPANDVRSFSAANDNIDVRLTPDGKTFVVAGKKKGRCDMLLVHKTGAQEIFSFEVFDR